MRAAYEPRSRRPHSSPAATEAKTVELVLALRARLTGEGLDAGADTIAWHLNMQHRIRLSRARVLLLIEDLNIRVIHAETGELLRELTLNPAKDYQPLRE